MNLQKTRIRLQSIFEQKQHKLKDTRLIFFRTQKENNCPPRSYITQRIFFFKSEGTKGYFPTKKNERKTAPEELCPWVLRPVLWKKMKPQGSIDICGKIRNKNIKHVNIYLIMDQQLRGVGFGAMLSTHIKSPGQVTSWAASYTAPC